MLHTRQMWIFLEKWKFSKEKHRTDNITEASLIIYQINSKLKGKKMGQKSLKSDFAP
jgi:hypothetical protein